MPNICENYLNIYIPTKNVEAFLADIAGPDQWPVPKEPESKGKDAAQISAHQYMEIESILQATQGEEKEGRLKALNQFKAMENEKNGRPFWMPVSRFEFKKFLAGAPIQTDHVPFSVARLAPWKDQAEFELYYKSSYDANGFWSHAENQTTQNGWYKMHMTRMGTKWTPFEIEVHEAEDENDGNTLLLITYQTAYGPIEYLGAFLRDVLAKHDAQALLVWKEEDWNSGYHHIDPANDIDDGRNFEHMEHTTEKTYEGYEDDDEGADDDETMRYTDWNNEALLDSVSMETDLPFSPRFS